MLGMHCKSVRCGYLRTVAARTCPTDSCTPRAAAFSTHASVLVFYAYLLRQYRIQDSTLRRRHLSSSRSHLIRSCLYSFLYCAPVGGFPLSPFYAPACAADAVSSSPVFPRKLVYNAFTPSTMSILPYAYACISCVRFSAAIRPILPSLATTGGTGYARQAESQSVVVAEVQIRVGRSRRYKHRYT